MSEALIHYSQARQALQKAKTIDEVVTIRNAAERLRIYSRQVGESLESQNDWAEIKFRAERRAGEMLKEGAENGDRAKQGGDKKSKSQDGILIPPTLEEIGITANQSSRWQWIASIPEPEFEGFIQGVKESYKELTEIALIRVAKREANERLRTEIKARPVVPPEGKYSCIVIDPPWPMKRIERDLYPNMVGIDYPTMEEDELKAYPLPDFADDNCHLYLWTTHRFLPMALRLAEHWGFKYQCLMTWVKNIGMAPYSWTYSTEHVLFCRRGNLPLERIGLRLDFHAKIREHSRKPDEFYDLVRQASPAPRLDLFSREKREGFSQSGNEPEKFEEDDNDIR